MSNKTMNLVKYCKNTHVDDVINKGRIFIGTFDRYKKIENEALRDMEEGPAIPAILDEQNDVVLSEIDNNGLLEHSSVSSRMVESYKYQKACLFG